MKEELISIIVPVYNVEKYIDRCVGSLRNQTYNNIEIILIDDGSPDRCPVICDEYARLDTRIKVIHKKNEGLGFARNSGLDISQGEYIVFVDSDDYVAKDMCEKLYLACKKYNADVVYGNINYDENGVIKLGRCVEYDTIWQGDREVKKLLLDFIANEPGKKSDTIMEVSVWKALFKKKIFDEYKIRFVSERQFISEDVIFDIDFLSHCGCVVSIPDPVYFYCVNPNSLSKSFRSDRFLRVKELYHEINRKLEMLYDEKVFLMRTDRFLIARARTNARQIIRHKKIIGKQNTIGALRAICNDKDLQSTLERYPIMKLPWKYAIVAFIMKKKSIVLLRVLLKG